MGLWAAHISTEKFQERAPCAPQTSPKRPLVYCKKSDHRTRRCRGHTNRNGISLPFAGGADRYVMGVALSRRAPSLTLPALIEHCLFVLPRASSGIRESEGLLGGEPGRRKGGARDRERDGGEKMARKGGKSWVPRCCTTTLSLSNKQNYHSGPKHINTDPMPWTYRIQLSPPSPPSAAHTHTQPKIRFQTFSSL